MSVTIGRAERIPAGEHVIVLLGDKFNPDGWGLSGDEEKYVRDQLKKENASQYLITVNQYKRWLFFQKVNIHPSTENIPENFRRAGNRAQALLNRKKIDSVVVHSDLKDAGHILAYVEGMALGNYQFLKYFSDVKKKKNSLAKIQLHQKGLGKEVVEALQIEMEAVFLARDLGNEPQSYLNAVQFAKDMERHGKKAGLTVSVLNKKKIEALKMGGLLAVNKGSIDEPTFTVLTWKPGASKNKKPVVLVGKGVVYDTGGLSLKPTPDSMDQMKTDMAGAAAVFAAMVAIARLKLPFYVIGLIPASDNRPGMKAYAPGDVVKMFDGSTVEVLNTDAEGRMLLADAMAYGNKYDPMLMVDMATLTGSASRAIGIHGMVNMGTAEEKTMGRMKEAGEKTFERVVTFPLWEDYAEDLRSTIADVTNLGGPLAGAITAGKFLQRFTKAPWIHLDIAGPTFLKLPFHYKPAGATGTGTRLLIEFLRTLSRK